VLEDPGTSVLGKSSRLKMKPVGFSHTLGKGKAIPLQASTDPEGSRRLRLPDFKKSAHEGGTVVSHMHWLPLHPVNIPGTHFC